MSELLIKGGTVIDGTGSPRYEADVLVEDGKIKAVGTGLGTAGQVIDATGLAVTPGLIDVHTHMDGQFFFEPQGSSSSWHGVTTVLMGHCGYSLAPVKPEDRDYIIHMFARVEEVPPHILQNNLPWDWEGFPEYLASLDRGLGINCVSQVGHSTLRYYVMGAAAAQRAATEDEVARMRQVLHESMEAGAFGFTTSRAPSQVAWDGTPVPSRYATPQELVSLAEVLKDFKAATLGLIPLGLFTGMTDEDKEVIAEMMRRSGGKTMQLNGASNDGARQYMADLMGQGLTAYSVTAAQPFYRYFTFREGTNAFNSMDAWWNVMVEQPADERLGMLADPALRATLRREVDAEATMDGQKMRRPRLLWSEVRASKVARPENKGIEGKSMKELAEAQGKHVVDVMLDLALSEDWNTQFLYRTTPESAWLSPKNGQTFTLPYVFPMNSDAGAHIANECKTGEGTYFLREWVLNRGIMPLEEGVRKLTSQAARWIGLADRGVVGEGMVADLALFDLDHLECLPKEQNNDLPGGETRWVQRASGVDGVLVSGTPTILHGRETGDLPGRVIRSTEYGQ